MDMVCDVNTGLTHHIFKIHKIAVLASIPLANIYLAWYAF